ncbi:reverse transcriptase domain-containing protein [Tanacetum coccineum]
MPKFNKWLSSLLRNKEKLEEIAITTVNAECSAIIMNKVPEKLEDPGKFLILCALQELNRTSALADSGASINLLPHSIYKKLGLEELTPTRMTLELANTAKTIKQKKKIEKTITHPMGIAEDVVVRVDGFTFLADFVVVNFEPDPRVPIILGRPFLRTAKALIDLYEETLTLRVGKEELVYYVDKSEKNKEKNFVHSISIIEIFEAIHLGQYHELFLLVSSSATINSCWMFAACIGLILKAGPTCMLAERLLNWEKDIRMKGAVVRTESCQLGGAVIVSDGPVHRRMGNGGLLCVVFVVGVNRMRRKWIDPTNSVEPLGTDTRTEERARAGSQSQKVNPGQTSVNKSQP